jgi:folate-binding Fe-S cluster repair protein YgfZ
VVVLSLHVQKVQHFFLTPFFLSSNAAMMSFLAKVPGNKKSKIERVFHKQKKSENSVSAMHAQRIMKGIQEAEAKLRAKHAPLSVNWIQLPFKMQSITSYR